MKNGGVLGWRAAERRRRGRWMAARPAHGAHNGPCTAEYLGSRPRYPERGEGVALKLCRSGRVTVELIVEPLP